MARRSSNWVFLLIVVLALAAMYTAIFWPRVRIGPKHNQAGIRLRGLLTGMVMYAQNNRDAFPPPGLTSSLLVNSGIASAELFEPPPKAPHEPAFFAVVPAEPEGRWSNSFRAGAPLVYANPAFLDGNRTFVGFTDGHTDLMSVPDLKALVQKAGGRIEPVK